MPKIWSKANKYIFLAFLRGQSKSAWSGSSKRSRTKRILALVVTEHVTMIPEWPSQQKVIHWGDAAWKHWNSMIQQCQALHQTYRMGQCSFAIYLIPNPTKCMGLPLAEQPVFTLPTAAFARLLPRTQGLISSVNLLLPWQELPTARAEMLDVACCCNGHHLIELVYTKAQMHQDHQWQIFANV